MNRIKEEEKGSEEAMEEARDLLFQGLGKIIKATFKASKKIVRSFKEGYSENGGKKNDR
jgi:hypothetical protein